MATYKSNQMDYVLCWTREFLRCNGYPKLAKKIRRHWGWFCFCQWTKSNIPDELRDKFASYLIAIGNVLDVVFEQQAMGHCTKVLASSITMEEENEESET